MVEALRANSKILQLQIGGFMTYFSFETPVKHLKDFEDLQDFHFTLSMLYSNKIYANFIMEQRSAGYKGIWLDNSFNELRKADSAHSLIELYKIYGFTKVICPDDPTWTNSQLHNEWLKMASVIPVNKLIVVVHDSGSRDYLKACGVKHFAYPFKQRRGVPIEHQVWAKSHHFLGLNNLEELRVTRPISCDTSLPIKLARIGMSIDQWVSNGCPIYSKGGDYFDCSLTTKEIELARQNIIKLKELTNESI